MKEEAVEHNFRYLDPISFGDVNYDDGQKLISRALNELTPAAARKICGVLRDWVWHAINDRRRDGELKQWYKILQRTSAFLSDRFPEESERLGMLYELVYESISVSQVLSIDDALRRVHVRKILMMMLEDSEHRIGRAALINDLTIKESNLSRVLGLMRSAGLIERHTMGKNAEFQLTPTGVEVAQKALRESESSRGGATKKYHVGHWSVNSPGALVAGDPSPPRGFPGGMNMLSFTKVHSMGAIPSASASAAMLKRFYLIGAEDE